MLVTDLLQWWNLIYALPLALSVVWILTTVLGAGHGHGGAHGHDGGHAFGHAIHHAGDHIHAHMHGHAHASVEHAGGHADGQGHASHNGHHDGQTSSFASKLMVILGLDDAPLTLMVGMFMLSWGVFGLLSNRFFGVLHFASIYIWPSMAVAFFVSAIITRTMAEVIGWIMPGDETYGVSRMELVGSLGKTVFSTGTSTGTVDIRDHIGTVHRVQAKCEDGQECISAGTEVMIIDYDEDDKRYIVRKSEV